MSNEERQGQPTKIEKTKTRRQSAKRRPVAGEQPRGSVSKTEVDAMVRRRAGGTLLMRIEPRQVVAAS